MDAVVITSINAATEAVVATMRELSGWRLFLVGDKKTPGDWGLEGADYTFLPWRVTANQTELAHILPANHYSRKNLGYLAAMQAGASRIYDTDDDNALIQGARLASDPHVTADSYSSPRWINVLRYFSDRLVWPRGLPLTQVRQPDRVSVEPSVTGLAPVQQYLANGDPDVDAVYRLVLGETDHVFKDRTVLIEPGTYTPFNSQCTVWFPQAFALLYLPSHVSFRMTDIWRGFIAQRCLQAAGHYLCYRGPIVHQDRNAHVLSRDFEQEVPGYLQNDAIIDVLEALELSGPDMSAHLRSCYHALADAELVPREELALLDAWLAELARMPAAKR